MLDDEVSDAVPMNWIILWPRRTLNGRTKQQISKFDHHVIWPSDHREQDEGRGVLAYLNRSGAIMWSFLDSVKATLSVEQSFSCISALPIFPVSSGGRPEFVYSTPARYLSCQDLHRSAMRTENQH